MHNIELIGFFAGICVLLSFCTSNVRKIRLINLVGCLLFVVYGLVLQAWSVMVINGCLFFVHLYKLRKEKVDD